MSQVRCSPRTTGKRFGELPARDFGPKKLKLLREDMIELGWTRDYGQQGRLHRSAVLYLGGLRGTGAGRGRRGPEDRPGAPEDRTAAREKEPIGPVADELVDAVLPHVSDLVADVIRTMRLTGIGRVRSWP